MPNWLLFLVPTFIWGTTWFTIKWQLGLVAPEVSVAYRFGAAAIVLLALCRLKAISLRFDIPTHVRLALLGLLQYSVSYVLVYESERYLTSGLTAVVYVLYVAWNVLGARVVFRRTLPVSVVLGAGAGITGVALVFGPEVSGLYAGHGLAWWGILLAVSSTLTASAGTLWAELIYSKDVSVAAGTAWSMLYGALAVALYCAARGIPFSIDMRLPYLASLAYLAVFGSAIAFITYFALLRRIGASRAGYTGAVIPVLAMATSTVFEGYRWTVSAWCGIALVFIGNVVVLLGKQRAS